ncbi:23S rRNA (adenine(2030)-N(6))-methyltransferase RlmJ [Szabonella alba]|uniref:Ribosomal RNA large subunit methyltransferase J n=1 Tax=Szabonella alba TaxID=2804194 RepID=A0A8K0Y1U2_9RHOB|nr:23S rRNA (adenine(2030)-N(6))-methyltransferase RlmJ [Szabonella alba]MBL4916414.1 23S rRNA (adenine(2030)-N(6))-methyltransferase RlmJ [Szabonella alba]
MLSYQHLYHAGNPADVHKHAVLAWILDYLTRKDKPLSYIETHAGRGLYDLSSPESLKTGEAAQGVGRMERHFAPDHPWRRLLDRARDLKGADAYPGSPFLAALALRESDRIHLAELHPQEHRALSYHLAPYDVSIRAEDGIAMALSLTPPTPRRGMVLIDPSWEVKTEYDSIPKAVEDLVRKWNVGIVALWYPLLLSGAHLPMMARLSAAFPEALRHEVRFPPVREGHRMVGSGLFVVNPPWGLAEETTRITAIFRQKG